MGSEKSWLYLAKRLNIAKKEQRDIVDKIVGCDMLGSSDPGITVLILLFDKGQNGGFQELEALRRRIPPP